MDLGQVLNGGGVEVTAHEKLAVGLLQALQESGDQAGEDVGVGLVHRDAGLQLLE